MGKLTEVKQELTEAAIIEIQEKYRNLKIELAEAKDDLDYAHYEMMELENNVDQIQRELAEFEVKYSEYIEGLE